MQKVFGIGLMKTGTSTLGACMRALGYNHSAHNREWLMERVEAGDLDAVFEWVDGYDSFDDWPWPLVYRELDARYPDAKFVLTVRDTRSWFRSVRKHADVWTATTGRRLFFGHPVPHFRRSRYVRRFEAYNDEVCRHFADRPEKLLVVDWQENSEWGPLCAFLGRPEPDAPFPHANPAKRMSLHQRLKRRLRGYLRALRPVRRA